MRSVRPLNPLVLVVSAVNEKEMNDFIVEWVLPYYLKILHGNYVYLKSSEQEAFNQEVKKALSTLNEAAVNRLLSAAGWREQITGSWFCGLKGWNQFADQIGKALVASQVGFAGQGYCFALACFTDETSVGYLTQYLDIYLPRIDCYYDQDWAMPALIWIDRQKNTNHSSRYLVSEGLWEKFVEDKLKGSDVWRLENIENRFWRVMEYCRVHFIMAKAA